MISNEEIRMLIAALGTGIGKENMSVDKIRYHKIVIMTDADVDGSHIRTLLLTFFYRQMPEVLEKGFVYIAQPPLYRVKKGQSERYIKDDRALVDYLVENSLVGIDIPGLKVGTSENELKAFVSDIHRLERLLENLSSRYDRTVVLELLPFLLKQQKSLPDFLSDESLINRFYDHFKAEVSKRPELGVLSTQIKLEAGTDPKTQTLTVSTTRFGTQINTIFRSELAKASEWIELTELWRRLEGFLPLPIARSKSQTTPDATSGTDRANSYLSYFDWLTDVLETSKKGLYIQRYKGLGEMNPEQLWETTLNPENRTLLRVQIEDAIAADETFSVLMGELVEPRRKFIEDNALMARELDV